MRQPVFRALILVQGRVEEFGKGSKLINDRVGVQLLHSWLMIHRITIKLRLPGKSRLISNSISSSAEVVTELYEILEQSLNQYYIPSVG